MQKLYILIIATLILTLHTQDRLMAQPGVGAMYIGDYSKMTSKSAMDREMANGSWIYRLENLKNSKYDFTLSMKDGSTRTVRSKLYADSAQHKSYVLDHGEKIYSDQTTAICRMAGNRIIQGMPTDSCWLFKIFQGKINAYSFLSEADGPFSFWAIQSGEGAIQKFDEQLLENLIADDAAALKALAKKDYAKAIYIYNTDHK